MIKGKSLAKEIKVEPWRAEKTKKDPFDTKEVSFHQLKVEIIDETGAIVNQHYGFPPGASQRRM